MAPKVTFGAWGWFCSSVPLVSSRILHQSKGKDGPAFMNLWKPLLTSHRLVHLLINFLQNSALSFLHGKDCNYPGSLFLLGNELDCVQVLAS